MVTLFNRKWTRKQLMARVGDASQFASARSCTLADGKAKGMAAVDLATGSGLRFTVLPDRALDIGAAEFCGRSLCWRSETGDVAPQYYQPEGQEWLYSFGGGLLATCGLTTFGEPSDDEGEQLGLHGRIGNTPAREVAARSGWDGEDYIVGVSGEVVESRALGVNIALQRYVFAFAGEKRIFVHDEVTNRAAVPCPHMILYHINLGFPVVSGTSRVLAPSLMVEPFNDAAEKGIEKHADCAPPKAGIGPEVFTHDLGTLEGQTVAGVVNPDLAFGVYVSYKKSQLPLLTQWKMLGARDYVIGLEPCTNRVGGRATERAAGRLRMLKPDETVSYDLEIGVLTGEEEIAVLERTVKKAMGRRKTKFGQMESGA